MVLLDFHVEQWIKKKWGKYIGLSSLTMIRRSEMIKSFDTAISFSTQVCS